MLILGLTFRQAVVGIFVAVASVLVGAQALPSKPTNLRAEIIGRDVNVYWDSSEPAASYYVLQAGTASGRYDLFNGPVGPYTFVTGRNLSHGRYYWRVQGVNNAGSGPWSDEGTFEMARKTCGSRPGAPVAFRTSVSGTQVVLLWDPPGDGEVIDTYYVEAGTAPGRSDLYNAPTRSAVSGLTVSAPPGSYYVRIRAGNDCGLGPVSDERRIDVGVLPPSACTYSLSPSVDQFMPASGGSITLNLTTQIGCRWRATYPPQWVSLEGGVNNTRSGSGPVTLLYSVMPNTGGGRVFGLVLEAFDSSTTPLFVTDIYQSKAGGCAITATPAFNTVQGGGGGIDITINADSGCSWRAESDSPAWLALTNRSSGVGSTTVRAFAQGNIAPTAAQRTGRIRIFGSDSTSPAAEITVSQGIGGCRYDVTPTTQSVLATGGTGLTLQVTSIGTNCAGAFTTLSPWITLVDGQQFLGAGMLTYDVAPNPGAQREGRILGSWTTGTLDFTVTQAGVNAVVADFAVSPSPCPIAGDYYGITRAYCSFEAIQTVAGAKYEWQIGTGRYQGARLGVGHVDMACTTQSVDVKLTVTSSAGVSSTKTKTVQFQPCS